MLIIRRFHIIIFLALIGFMSLGRAQTMSSINAGYLSSDSKENFYFKTPSSTKFNDAIFNNEQWFVGISSALNGEFVESANFQSIELSNDIAINYKLRHFGAGRLGFFGALGWVSGFHKQNFDVVFFDSEINETAIATGQFNSHRNIFDFQTGISLNLSSKSNFFIDTGPIVQYVAYEPVTATIRDFSFQYTNKETYVIPGFGISTQYLLNPKNTIAFGVYAEGKLLLIDSEVALVFGLGASVVLNHRNKKVLPMPEIPSPIHDLAADNTTKINQIPNYLINANFASKLEFGNNTLENTYVSAFTKRPNVLKLEDLILYQFDDLPVYVPNPYNYIPEVEKFALNNLKFVQPSPYTLLPNFLSFDANHLNEEVTALSIKTDQTEQSVYIIKSLNFNSFTNYPDLERKIAGGQSRASEARAAKEQKLKERDSILKVYDSLENRYNQLVYIDKILDDYPDRFKGEINEILDSLASAGTKESMAQIIISKTEAQKDDCLKKTEALEDQLKNRKKKCIELEEAIYKAVSKLEFAYFFKMAITAEVSLDGKGGFSVKFTSVMLDHYDKTTRKSRKEISQMRKDLQALLDELEACKKETEQLRDAIESTKKLCEELNSQIDLQQAVVDGAQDYASILQDQLEYWCEALKSALKNRLQKYCDDNPDLCNFKNELEVFLARDCPKNKAEWEAFWNEFQDILGKKKSLESDIKSDLEDLENEYDNNLDETDALDNDLQDALADIADAQAEAASRSKAEADADRVAAEEKQKRDAARADRIKKEEEIRDLIDDIKNGEVGEDAIEDLVKLIGLGVLDDLTGNAKIGTIIGGLLVLKDQPDCVCPIFVALKSALAAAQRGDDMQILIYANEFIKLWKDCGNLPILPTSIMEGTAELTKAIKNMTREQIAYAVNGLESAIKLNCK